MSICMVLLCLLGTAAETAADEALSNLVEGWPRMSDINEETGLLMDAEDCGVLYSLNRDTIRYPASTTKILTALLVLENASLDDVVTMTSTGTQMAVGGSSNANTKEGEEFTVEQCLYILLLKSANDIANQLAEHVGGTLEHFVEMMNEKARDLGCTNSHFCNPSGMPDSEHYTTAVDLALIMRAALQNEDFVRISGTEKVTIPPTNLTSESREYTNHNALVVQDSGYYYEDCIAGKTGYTDSAWRTYVGAARRDGRTLICVLMKGPDKTDFMDAASLFEYGFNNFEQLSVEGGSMTLPKGMTADDTTDEIFEGPEGKKHVEFYYRQLPVGMADMTETGYALLRHLEPPAVESVVTEETSAAETAEAAPAEESGSGQASRKGGGGLVILIVLIILALAGFGGLLVYRDYQERKRQAERRRKIMERRRKQEKKDGEDTTP